MKHKTMHVRENADMAPVVGIGAQDDFEEARHFLNKTGVHTTIVWEGGGNIWRIQNLSHTPAMQVYSYDLTHGSGVVSFNNRGRQVVFDASSQPAWAAAASTTAP